MKQQLILTTILCFSIFVFTQSSPVRKSPARVESFYYFVTADCGCSKEPLGEKKFHKYFSSIKRGEPVYGNFDDAKAEANFRNFIIASYNHCPWERTVLTTSAYTSSRNFKTYDEAEEKRLEEIASFKRRNPTYELHF